MEHATVRQRWIPRGLLALCAVLLATAGAQAQRDPLPSWNDGPAKKAILTFVKDTTEKSSPKYVEPKDRIATFDQDGTLWTEQPLYSQAMFALDRVGKLAPQHPEWKDEEPFKSVLAGDHAAMGKFTEIGLGGNSRRHACGDEHGRVSGARKRMDLDGQSSALRPAVHRARLPAHVGSDEISARERIPRPTSSPAAARSSSAFTASRCTASRPSRSWGRAS